MRKGLLEAMRNVQNGADVWDMFIARDLREVERRAPELISITKPMMFRGTGAERMPYFGAILTKAGRAALRELGLAYKEPEEREA